MEKVLLGVKQLELASCRTRLFHHSRKEARVSLLPQICADMNEIVYFRGMLPVIKRTPSLALPTGSNLRKTNQFPNLYIDLILFNCSRKTYSLLSSTTTIIWYENLTQLDTGKPTCFIAIVKL